MRKRIGVLSLMLTLWAGATPAPPRPGPDAYVVDSAGVLSAVERVTLTRLVREKNASSGSHLFVVSVASLKPYGHHDVKEATKACFSEWELGEADVLFYLSASERKAWIHLGFSWSGRWEMVTQRILRDVVAPACEKGECGRALMEGCERLLPLSGAGPSAPMPARNWLEWLENLGATASSRSGLPWRMCLIFMGGGIVLLLCSLLPLATVARVFSLTLGLVLLVSCYSAQGVLSAFWVLAGLGVLWVAGAAIQAGFQAGAPPRDSSPLSDDSGVSIYGE